MGLPTELLDYFALKNGINQGTQISPRSIGDYVTANPGANGPTVRQICQKLAHEGLLIHSGVKNNTPLFGDCFYCFGKNEEMAKYGGYDFLIHGMEYLRKHFVNSVHPIIVKNRQNDEGIGTCFVLGENLICTARHCVEDMNNIKISGLNGEDVEFGEIYTSRNPQVDVAFLFLKGSPFKEVPNFKMGTANVLDDVLTMGYPPIPGFNAIQFAEKGTISTHLKASTGNVVGQDKSYWGEQDFLLINAKVKGGNSGGPLINKFGFVVGILVDIPADPENAAEFDKLGYGVAIPAADLASVWEKIANDEPEISKIPFKILTSGISTLLNKPNEKAYLDQ